MFNRMPDWVRQHVAALRALIVFTVVLGIGYPLVILAVAQIPGLQHRANGSLVHLDGKVVGSAVIGQSFLKPDGSPNPLYFQSRPSDAGDGYDPTATSASNLGPEDIMDTLPDPSVKGDTGTPSLLTQVCTRSHNVGVLEGVDGQRPYCTSAGIGAVLSVIRTHGVTGAVQKVVSVNQECPATPSNPVPPDAVTASGSGLDPDISPAYAALQTPRVARERHLSTAVVTHLVKKYTSGRTLGFMGQPVVNVLQLNLALDRLTGSQ
jgi:K+-transporting ATPase ATPase C chain